MLSPDAGAALRHLRADLEHTTSSEPPRLERRRQQLHPDPLVRLVTDALDQEDR